MWLVSRSGRDPVNAADVTLVAFMAAAAGVLAAVGLVDLLAEWSRRCRRPHTSAPDGDPRRLDRPAGPGSSPAADPTTPTGTATGTALRVLAAVGGRFPARAPDGLSRRIDAAGIEATTAELMAFKAGMALVALALAALAGASLPGRLLWVVLPGAPLAGFLAPDLWLRRRSSRRRRAMDEQLGDVLELLRVAVEAGLTVPRALGEVGRRHAGVLAVEIARMAVLLELGVSQRQALDVLVRRCPAPGVATLAATLRRAERHGSPLGEALAAQAEEARARRARLAIEHAARAAPKIQLVVALLLVPSAMLLMAAAMLPALAWR